MRPVTWAESSRRYERKTRGMDDGPEQGDVPDAGGALYATQCAPGHHAGVHGEGRLPCAWTVAVTNCTTSGARGTPSSGSRADPARFSYRRRGSRRAARTVAAPMGTARRLIQQTPGGP